MKSFSQWTIDEVEKEFHLQLQRKSELLDAWLQSPIDSLSIPTATLETLRNHLIDHVYSWNETELKIKFIGPLLSLVNFDEEKYQSFFERTIVAPYQNDTLAGDVDFLVATGMRVPEQPYFFLHEHKKEADSSGDPLGQLMIAMVAAQILNQQAHPIYGAYVMGRLWIFVVLYDHAYAVSLAYDATKEAIYDIFRILTKTKAIITELVLVQ